MIARRLAGAGALVVAMAASGAEVPPPAAGVVVGLTGRAIVERSGAAPREAALGMRLEPSDVVVVERGGAAEIYLKGGGIVHLRDATRFEVPRGSGAAPAAGGRARLASGSIAQLESGLWVLNDPAGSLLVSPMRGDGAWVGGEGATPLSPRYEVVVEPSVAFLWSGGPALARVVVSLHRDVVWRSEPASSGAPLRAGGALPLTPGEVYTWWLEPEAGGAPLSAGTPFRAATPEVRERTKDLETSLRALAETPEGAAAADYLRLAHYTGSASWTKVLELASRLPAGEARSRALDAAAAGLRLDARSAASLAELLGKGPKN